MAQRLGSATAPRPERTRLPWAADLTTALTGLALEAGAAFFLVIAAGLSNWSDPRGSNGGADRADQFLVFGLGFLACLSLLQALLFRARAPITAALHLLLAAALALGVLTAATSGTRPRRPAPPPGKAHAEDPSRGPLREISFSGINRYGGGDALS